MTNVQQQPIFPATATLIPFTFTHQHPHATSVTRTLGAMLGPRLPERPTVSYKTHKNAERYRSIEAQRNAYERPMEKANNDTIIVHKRRNTKRSKISERYQKVLPLRLPTDDEYQTPRNISPYAMVSGKTRATSHHNHYTGRAHAKHVDPYASVERQQKRSSITKRTPVSQSRKQRARTPSYLQHTASSRNHSSPSRHSGSRNTTTKPRRLSSTPNKRSIPLLGPLERRRAIESERRRTSPTRQTLVHHSDPADMVSILEDRNRALGQELREMKRLLKKMTTKNSDKATTVDKKLSKTHQRPNPVDTQNLRFLAATEQKMRKIVSQVDFSGNNKPDDAEEYNVYSRENLHHRQEANSGSFANRTHSSNGSQKRSNRTGTIPSYSIFEDLQRQFVAQQGLSALKSDELEASHGNQKASRNVSSSSSSAEETYSRNPSRVDLSTIDRASAASALTSLAGAEIHVPTASRRHESNHINKSSMTVVKDQHSLRDVVYDGKNTSKGRTPPSSSALTASAIEALLLKSSTSPSSGRPASMGTNVSRVQRQWEDSPSRKSQLGELEMSANRQKGNISPNVSTSLKRFANEQSTSPKPPSRSETFRQQQEAYWLQSRALISQLEKAIKKAAK